MAPVRNVTSGPKAVATNTDAPSAPAKQVIAGITVITDSLGRKIGLRKLKPSERYALSEAVEAATMSANMQLLTAASVISLDDEGLPPISSRAELLARLDMIGDEGLGAITQEVLQLYGVDLSPEAIEAAKN